MQPVKKKEKKCITNTQNKTYMSAQQIQEKKTTQTTDENRTETHKN